MMHNILSSKLCLTDWYTCNVRDVLSCLMEGVFVEAKSASVAEIACCGGIVSAYLHRSNKSRQIHDIGEFSSSTYSSWPDDDAEKSRLEQKRMQLSDPENEHAYRFTTRKART
jgi:hypothetical protein